MKQEVNSYSVRTYARTYDRALGATRSFSMRPRVPNFVWMAMIVLAVAALSYSAYSKSRGQERAAKDSYEQTAARVENAKSANRHTRAQTARIKQNARTAAAAAQSQLGYVRRNEVVVAVR